MLNFWRHNVDHQRELAQQAKIVFSQNELHRATTSMTDVADDLVDNLRKHVTEVVQETLKLVKITSSQQ